VCAVTPWQELGISNMLVLNDDDVNMLIDMAGAIAAVEPAFKVRPVGGFVAPPRHYAGFPNRGELVFTVGGLKDGPVGFRVYDTLTGGGRRNPQLIAVWDAPSGCLEGIVTGNRLGRIRTGAIGGLAIRHMAPRTATIATVIGAGRQARTQIEAAAAVRDLSEIRVCSRSIESMKAFAREMAGLDVPVSCVGDARDAVEGADIVICATTSREPVIEAAWLKNGAHVSTVGPKLTDGHELPLEVAERASVIATDSIAQVEAMGGRYFLMPTPMGRRMTDLARVVSGEVAPRRGPDELTLFCSVGLAGTEVLIAAEVLARARRSLHA
jgi:alanine dehydrogenase